MISAGALVAQRAARAGLLGEGPGRPGRCASGRSAGRGTPRSPPRSPSALDRVEPGDLGGDRLDLVLAHVRRARAAARSRPSWISTMAALRAPMPGDCDAHQGRSTSQPRSSAATSSGWRSTRAASSSRISSARRRSADSSASEAARGRRAAWARRRAGGLLGRSCSTT